MQVEVVVFDVNETLSDMSPLAARFEQVGAPGWLAATWFAALLRDGFGLAAAGASLPFVEIAAGVLRPMLAEAGAPDPDAGTDHVLAGFAELDVHPDVREGVRALRAAGLRLVSLTNGSVQISGGLFERTGLREAFDQVLSVEDAPAWKPARSAYDYAAACCGVDPDRMLMVAVHPWDVDGAARAGLRTAWLDRSGARYPTHLTRPDLSPRSLPELAGLLTA